MNAPVPSGAALRQAILSCYRLDLDERAWTEGLTKSFEPLVGHGKGVGAWRFSPGQWTTKELPVGVSPEIGHSMWNVATGFTPEEMTQVFLGDRVAGAAHRLRLRGGLDEHRGVGRFVRPLGIKDYHALSVIDGGGFGIAVAGASADVVGLSRLARSRLERVASHLLAGLRLRHTLTSDEAVLTPDGKTVHAEGPATELEAREALRAAVVAWDHAHSRKATKDEDAAVDAWTALVSGRWSVVERFEADGRRFLVARRNQPNALDTTALSGLESHALLLRAQGLPYKAVAYELGLSTPRVHRLVQAARSKLGVRDDVELVRLFGRHAQQVLQRLRP
jgi:DNA-binding CsgD family transcriptional regulator